MIKTKCGNIRLFWIELQFLIPKLEKEKTTLVSDMKKAYSYGIICILSHKYGRKIVRLLDIGQC